VRGTGTRSGPFGEGLVRSRGVAGPKRHSSSTR
jgi:hypothetical protein